MSTEQAGLGDCDDALPDEPWRYECPIHGRRVRIRGVAADCDGDERWGSHSTLLVRDKREGEIIRTDRVTLHGALGGAAMTQESPLADADAFGFPECEHCDRVTIAMSAECPWCGHRDDGP